MNATRKFGKTAIANVSRRRCVRLEAAVSTIPLFKLPEKGVAHDTAQAVISAVANSTCAPYMDIASENTLMLNPPWSKMPRAQVCRICMLTRRAL
jgi:hypothetical protein